MPFSWAPQLQHLLPSRASIATSGLREWSPLHASQTPWKKRGRRCEWAGVDGGDKVKGKISDAPSFFFAFFNQLVKTNCSLPPRSSPPPSKTNHLPPYAKQKQEQSAFLEKRAGAFEDKKAKRARRERKKFCVEFFVCQCHFSRKIIHLSNGSPLSTALTSPYPRSLARPSLSPSTFF